MIRKFRTVRFSLIMFAVSFCWLAGAQARETGAAFLKIGAGARPVGMASAYTAIANEVNALYWNPAGTAEAGKNQVGFTHTEWIENMNYEFAGFVHPNSRGAVGLGVIYLAQGTFEGRDENRQPTSDFSASDLAVLLSMSRAVMWGSIGVNLKIINQTIESESASGVALDMGLKLNRNNSPLSIGAAVHNLGPDMKFIDEAYSLPLTLSVGAGYRLLGALTMSMDVRRRVYTEDTEICVGTEYWVYNTVALRTGYLSNLSALAGASDDSGIDDIKGLGAGVGIKVFKYNLDYSLSEQKDLGNTHRISFSTEF